MLRQIIGAAIGSKFAKQTPAIGGATGAALGAAVPFVLSRMSLPAMVVMGAGGYFAKRMFDRKKAEDATDQAQRVSGVALKTPGEVPPAATGTVINPPSGIAANQAH